MLTVREEKEKKSIEAVNRILVPMDFSDHAISALSYAKEIAATFDAQLQVVHVIEESVHPACYAIGKSSVFELMPDVKNKSEKEMRRLFEESSGPSSNAEYHVIEGFASSEILRFAKKNKSDLIIIATHGLTGLKHLLLGSVAEKVVRAAECPVFTVKSYGKSLL